MGRAGPLWLAATTGYPTSRHVLDVCVGDASRSLAIECDVHSDGPEAHVERHLVELATRVSR